MYVVATREGADKEVMEMHSFLPAWAQVRARSPEPMEVRREGAASQKEDAMIFVAL